MCQASDAQVATPRVGREALRTAWESFVNALCCVRALPDEDAAAAKHAANKGPRLRGILRAGHDGRLKSNKEHIRWRTVLVGDEAGVEDQRAKALDEAEERERKLRFEQWMKLARLPALTMEELLIPVRIAFPELTVATPVAILLDVFIDLFEIGWIVKTLRENPPKDQQRTPGAGEAGSDDAAAREEYTAADVMRDGGMAISLHIARGIYIISGDNTLWTLVQVVRSMRIYVLGQYVNQINSDLSTNVKFLAVYKFSLVMVSIPHWVACIWWALATTWGSPDLPLPSWPAQFKVLSGNPELEPLNYSSWHRYLMSLYMSWAGLICSGYGTLVIAAQSEVIYASLVAMVHIVFNAFVLGTLLHYLVRTNESTVHFNELMKAVETYVSERKLPPELSGKIRAHYAFQHRKQAAGTDRIFAQMPLSMRTEVAVAQYDRQMHATWVFWNCTPQFLSYVALFLRERHMMPTETLFKRGDGAAELPWCVRGALHVAKGEAHITTIRSDLGPGQIVGELAFFIGIQQPYTVVASSKGEVTLVVLSSASFDEIIGSYPEQADNIMTNVLRKYALDKKGADLATGGGFQEQMDEDELKEFDELRGTIRTAILEHNEELFAQMVGAIKAGDVETVRALIARGFEPSLGSYDGRKPLHLAALEGHKTIVRALCELGASVNDVDRFGSTPIRNAIDGMHGAVAEELARHGARLQLAQPASRMHKAAKEGDMASMTMLVAHGIDINCANFDGRTALHVAAYEGNARVAEYLISNMADVHTRDRWARSPLDDAIEQRHPLVAQMLARNSARPNAQAMAEQLRAAAALGDTTRLRFLLDMGAAIDATDYDERAALHYAVRSASLSAVHLLVCALADVNMPDRWLRPPLLDALELSKPVAAVLALQCGARLPAHCAANAGLQQELAEARGANMYELNRTISAWTRSEKESSEGARRKTREIEMAFSALADEFSALAHAKRALFKQVGKFADIWINEYADEGDSDTDSDVDDEDGAQVEHVLDDDDDDDDDSADGARARSGDTGASASQFIKLVLQLPSAEAGLSELRRLFALHLPPGAFRHLAAGARAHAEEQTLREVLGEQLGLSRELAEAVIADIYAELRTFLGKSAPLSAAEYDSDAPAAGSGTAADSVVANELERTSNAAEPSPRARTPDGPRSGDRRLSGDSGSARDDVRRGSHTGANLLEFTKAVHQRHDGGTGARKQSRGMSRARTPSGLFGGGAGADDDGADGDSRVFLSELGHVVLLCSRRFIDECASKYTQRARSEDGAASSPPVRRAGGVDDGADDSDGDRRRKRGLLARMQLRVSMEKLEAKSSVMNVVAVSSMRAAAAAAVVVPADAQGGAAGDADVASALGFADEAAAVRRRFNSVGKATHVIRNLFKTFDLHGKGTLQLRDVKRLQGELGELGSEEIKSLVSYLISASLAFAAVREPRADSGPMPFIGRRPSADGRRASGSGRGGALRESLPAIVIQPLAPDGARSNRPRSKARATLDELTAAVRVEHATQAEAVGAPAAANADGGSGAPSAAPDAAAPDGSADPAREWLRERKPKGARSLSEVQFFIGVSSWILLSTPDEHAPGADDADGATPLGGAAVGLVPRLGTLALHGDALDRPGGAGAARVPKAAARAEAIVLAQREEALARELGTALGTGAALALLADHAQQRMDKARVKPTDIVEPAELFALVSHSIVLPPLATPLAVSRWCAARLGLEVGGVAAADADDFSESSRSAANSEAGDRQMLLRKALARADKGDGGGGGGATSWRELHARLAAAASERREANGIKVASTGARRAFGCCGGGGGGGGSGAGDGGADELEGESARPWYIVSVHTPWVGHFNLVFLFCVWWDTIAIPMQLAFIEQTHGLAWIFAVNTVLDALYLVRIALQLHTTFVNTKSVEVWRPREIRQEYLHGAFVLDLLANFPHDLLGWMFGVEPLTIFALRLPRMINCRHTNAAFSRWKAQLHEADFAGGLLKYFAPLCLTIHYMSCVWNVIGFNATVHAKVALTWADLFREDQARITPGGVRTAYASEEAQIIDQYILSLDVVTAYISGLGPASVPASFLEFGGAILLSILNTTVYAWCVGGISGLVMKQDDEIVLKRAQLELVHSYVRHVHVPNELKERMTKFFQQRLQHASLSTVDQDQIYAGLPMPLQMEVAAQTNRALVGSCALLRGCSAGFLDRLSSALVEREIDGEASIFRTGEACKELLLIAAGTVELRGDDTAETQAAAEVLGQGDVLGDVAFVFGIRHFNSARCGRSKCNVFALTAEAYRELLKSFPAQEDVIMDNAMRKHDGMGTARSGKSKASGAASSRGSSAGRSAHSADGRSVAGSAVTGAGGGAFELQRVLGDAKRRREELMHAQLCTACAHGDYDKVRRMLTSRSIDIDGSDFAGRCAIHLAACSGSTRVLELLIVGRADVNAEDERGVTPLTEALLADHTAAAELLVAHGGRHGSRDVSEQVCSIASSDDGATQLRRLCLFGGNVNARTHEGRTPLHVAAGEGRVANAQVLLDSKGDINVRDRHGATPLQDALLGRKDDMCAALLARGAQLGDFNAAEHMNKAVAANDLVHLSRLLRFGCAINSRDALGRTPLHLAASCRRINALSLLLDTHGIDVNAEDHFGNTPYDDALREQSAERQVIVALFASRGARLGSHVSRVVAASSARLDDERVRLADGALRAHDRTLVQAKVLSRWVREEREAVRAFKGQIEQAIRYERESGAVLADEHPELWDHIYAFAECHFDWRAEALGSVQPMIDRWRVETKEFALLTVQRLAQKFSELCAICDADAKPVERLYEVTFRKPVKVFV